MNTNDIVILVTVMIIFLITSRKIAQYVQNEKSPILEREARIIYRNCNERSNNIDYTNRDSILRNSRSNNYYYLKFEFSDGKHIKFKVSKPDYYFVSDSDVGKVIYQGTRYLGFRKLR